MSQVSQFDTSAMTDWEKTTKTARTTVEVWISNFSVLYVSRLHNWTLRGVPIVSKRKGKVGGKMGLRVHQQGKR